jgi:NADH-quinone oxidoreductase subunit G
MLAAGADGGLDALVVGAVEGADLPDAGALDRALARTPFVVSLELRVSDVHEHADVVFPVSTFAEKGGTFVDWEGRPRTAEAALASLTRSDAWVLDALAAEMGHTLGVAEPVAARAELEELGQWDGAAPAPPEVPAGPPVAAAPGQAVLATWRLLLDLGRLQDDEPHLAGTAHAPVARVSAATAAEVDVADG